MCKSVSITKKISSAYYVPACCQTTKTRYNAITLSAGCSTKHANLYSGRSILIDLSRVLRCCDGWYHVSPIIGNRFLYGVKQKVIRMSYSIIAELPATILTTESHHYSRMRILFPEQPTCRLSSVLQDNNKNPSPDSFKHIITVPSKLLAISAQRKSALRTRKNINRWFE